MNVEWFEILCEVNTDPIRLEGGQRGGLKSVEVGMIEIYFLLISRQL
jgi:hypothetical protein